MTFNINKFGGTSVGTSSAMKQVAEILASETHTLAVLSACSGITNKLIQIAQLAIVNLDEAIRQIDEVAKFHFTLAEELEVSLQTSDYIYETARELTNLAKGINLLQEKQVSVEARIIAKGELLSTYIFNRYLVNKLNLTSSLLFAPDYLQFDGLNYSLQKKTELIKAISENQICVTQGFIASSPSGQITNLGRGGSDWSAAIFGAELGAEKINIWTDVDGILTSDPRIVEETKLIAEIDYDSIKLAALLGAKVLHPETIAPAMQKGIEVCIRNTFNLASQGSLIRENSQSKNVIIATKQSITCIKAMQSEELVKFLKLINEANITIYFLQEFADEFQIFIDSSHPNFGFIIDNYLPQGALQEHCDLLSIIETGNMQSLDKKLNFEISSLLGIFNKEELTLFLPMANERTNLFFLKTDRLAELANLLHKAINKTGKSGY